LEPIQAGGRDQVTLGSGMGLNILENCIKACYLELLGKHELKQENRPAESQDKLQQTKEEQPSTETSRKRLVR